METAGVKVFARTLGDRGRGILQEKGVDVSLAIDFVAGAVAGTFDVGVIFSTDSDLTPALEFVLERPQLGVTAEVAVWDGHPNAPLRQGHRRTPPSGTHHSCAIGRTRSSLAGQPTNPRATAFSLRGLPFQRKRTPQDPRGGFAPAVRSAPHRRTLRRPIQTAG